MLQRNKQNVKLGMAAFLYFARVKAMPQFYRPPKKACSHFSIVKQVNISG